VVRELFVGQNFWEVKRVRLEVFFKEGRPFLKWNFEDSSSVIERLHFIFRGPLGEIDGGIDTSHKEGEVVLPCEEIIYIFLEICGKEWTIGRVLLRVSLARAILGEPAIEILAVGGEISQEEFGNLRLPKAIEDEFLPRLVL